MYPIKSVFHRVLNMKTLQNYLPKNTKHYFFSFLHHKASPRDATLPKHTTFLEMTPAGIYNSDDFAPAMTLLLSVTLSPLANDSQSTELPPVSEFSLLPLSVSGANATVLYRLLRLMVQYLHQPRQLHRQARPLPRPLLSQSMILPHLWLLLSICFFFHICVYCC